MVPLADAARRIEERDLDFEVGTSGVREIDDVLGAMDEMRASLKDSLEAQWRSEQAQREQIAALAHDLKTPLTVVRGNVDLLLEGELTDDQRPCAVDAAEGARQMGTYLAALIDATLGDATAFAPVERPLRPLLARLRAQAEALAACGGAQVAWSEGAGLPEALRMDEALVERGCERFYQGDPARAARGHRGLGLHVAAEAAARHGGSVELANRDAAEGRGARVTLRLPLG